MSIVVRRAFVFLVSVALLAPTTSALDPASKAFRSAAKSAEKDVRLTANASVKTVKSAFADALAAFKDDGDLQAAIEAGADAVTRALTGNATASRDAGTTLAGEGAALLADVTSDVPADFRDGGGGAWDAFKSRTEAHLSRVDLKVSALFAKFVTSLTKLSQKSAGHDPDVRYALHPHDDLLHAVLGPVLVDAGAPLALVEARAQVLIDVRFLTVEDDLLQTVGVDYRSLGAATLLTTEADGNTITSSGLIPDVGGSLLATVQLSTGVFGPLTYALSDAAENELAAGTGSVPTQADAPNEVLAPFRASIKLEFSFGGKQLKVNTKNCAKSLGELAKAHKQGDVTTAQALGQGLSFYRQAQGSNCFWLDLVRNKPVDQAVIALADDGADDGDVAAVFMPDGGGDLSKGLAKLERRRVANDAKLAHAFESFMAKIGKQDEMLTWSFVQQAPRPLPAPFVDLGPTTSLPDPDPQTLIGGVARIDDGKSVGLLGLYSGVAKQGLGATTTSLVEHQGDTISLAGTTAEFGGAFEAEVPGLSDVPVLGWLFRTQSEARERVNTIVLVTPSVIQALER